MSCNHNNTSKQFLDLEYFGLLFNTQMEVCLDCGAHLWTQENKDGFNLWLSERKKDSRDNFIVQVSLSNHSKACAEEMFKAYPGVNLSTIIRAMTLVFLHFLETPETAEIFESVAEGTVYETFLHGERTSTKVQFNPSGMLDLHSWAKIMHIKPSKLVEEAVYRVTSLHVDHDPKLKEFWEKQILPQIALILKSAA